MDSYYDPESIGSFGGVDRLYRSVKHLGVSRKDVEEFLRGERTYTVHKPVRRNYPRIKTYVSGIDKQWQADLADVKSLAHFNGGTTFLLTVIDVFSKFAWVVPVKSKSASVMLAAFKSLFESAHPRKPERIQTDKGKEFFNKLVQDFLKSQNVKHFASHSDQKASVAERFNRTIKTRIWHYLTYKNTKRYIDVLQQLVNSYNKSFHRSIGMAPIAVSKKNENEVWVKLFGDGGSSVSKHKLKEGDKVRVTMKKGDFDKGYIPNWSLDHLVVSNSRNESRPVYKLRRKNGEQVDALFYPEEIQKISKNTFLVEKVIQKKNGKALVKWKGWSNKYNSWIPVEQLTRENAEPD